MQKEIGAYHKFMPMCPVCADWHSDHDHRWLASWLRFLANQPALDRLIRLAQSDTAKRVESPISCSPGTTLQKTAVGIPLTFGTQTTPSLTIYSWSSNLCGIYTSIPISLG